METFEIKQLTFIYPNKEVPAICDLSLTINKGEFIGVCGKSGCGKSTLLRHLKTVLTPHGIRTGEIIFEGKTLETVDQRIQSSQIGYVLQSPDNQIVTDKVWHELAFGLESLGMDTPTIRLRVAEMANFFGIQTWFHKSVTELSGGQKQILNLASIMTMHPSVLILDEPTSQLDPIAASDFLQIIGKINRELGTTIIMSEHRLDEVLPFCDRLVVIDNGKLITQGSPKEVGFLLKQDNHELFLAMPTPMRIYAGVTNDFECPLTVRDGREWLDKIGKIKSIEYKVLSTCISSEVNAPAIQIDEVWFKYEKNSPDIIKGLSMTVKKGELFAILGGNGTGKTTTLSIIMGENRPYRGKISVQGSIAALPQNPQALFVKKTVEQDLYEIFANRKMKKEQKEEKVWDVARLCLIEDLMQSHPYDLSGGEQQRVALAKVLLIEPQILLLDEPTKGLDAYFKLKLAEILKNLQAEGVTIVMVSHDVEFCASYADRCAMFFDGNIVTTGNTRQFFIGNSFYTSAANRMARHLIPQALTVEDVIAACGGTVKSPEFKIRKNTNINRFKQEEFPYKDKMLLTPFISQVTIEKHRLTHRTMIAALMILIFIPLTIYFGIYYLNDRKYYIISMLIIIETMIPFIMVFESRKPQAREIIIIAVLCAIAVAGRTVFFMLPQFKPVVSIVIIAGLCFGGETGFLVGAVSGFVSNFFAGQGPWTPWQMFGFGIIGFLAGVLFQKGILRRNKIALCLFGGITTFFIYGFLLNTASILMVQSTITWEMIMLACLRGIPFDLIHALSTMFFLWLIADPMIEKLDRIKLKYGLVDPQNR
ncbi:ECF transporter S component [Cellulosilyticum sp. WCF-2]|uniref:ECF transporter S component n=1 Tax=Cellulosilyticum sp. WCF-2 TaxID=2497860 RepID=UPI000F8C8A06|nr:ATP-binding cassette domain-containing protein [Cellulosilyticum sp. WCF-2]